MGWKQVDSNAGQYTDHNPKLLSMLTWIQETKFRSLKLDYKDKNTKRREQMSKDMLVTIYL